MTEAALDGGASAPAERSGAPLGAEVQSHTNPLGTQTPVAEKPVEPEAPKPSQTVAEAVRKANETIKARAEAKDAPKADAAPVKPVEAKPEPKAEQPRENGRFAPAEPKQDQGQDQPQDKPVVTAHRDPPARFDDAAKAEWERAPESIKGAVHRTIRELEQGHQKYKADAEAFHEIREYGDLAKQSGTTVKAALDNYVGIERLLRQDPISGLERIVGNLNLKSSDGRQVGLRDLAAHILGQTPEESASRQDATIRELRAELAQIKQQVGGVTQTIQKQNETATMQQVEAFAASHPRFEELAAAIKEEIDHGYDLEAAYTRADRLNPAAQGGQREPLIPAPDALAQTQEARKVNPAGQKSVSGAPASGSDPETPRKPGPLPSIRESLKRASSRVS